MRAGKQSVKGGHCKMKLNAKRENNSEGSNVMVQQIQSVTSVCVFRMCVCVFI